MELMSVHYVRFRFSFFVSAVEVNVVVVVVVVVVVCRYVCVVLCCVCGLFQEPFSALVGPCRECADVSCMIAWNKRQYKVSNKENAKCL